MYLEFAASSGGKRRPNPDPGAGPTAKRIEAKVEELATLPEVTLTPEEYALIAEAGDNHNCMTLKGANPEFTGDPLPDRWSLNRELEHVAQRWQIDPSRDLASTMAEVTFATFSS